MLRLSRPLLWRTFLTCRVRTLADTVNKRPSVARSGDAARKSACATVLSMFLVFGPLAFAEPADSIYTARYVVTMDAHARPDRRRRGRGSRRAHRGRRERAPTSRSNFKPAQRIDRPDAILMPGLINTHTHAAMSLFRGIADDLKLQDWLEKFIFPAEAKNVTADFVLWGTRLACLEMMLSGTTTYVDMYYFEDRVAEATKEAGMRGVLGETIIGFKVADSATPEDALRYTEKFMQRFKDDPLIVPAVAPHAIYTNNDATLKAARALANKYDAPLVIHVPRPKRRTTTRCASAT